MFLRVVVGLLVMVGLVGLGLAVFASVRTGPAPVVVAAAVPAPPPPPPHHILVTSRAIRAGTLLLIEDLATRDVPAGQEPVGSYPDSIADRDRIRGAMVRRTLEPNETILSSDILRPGDRGFLAAVLKSGMRAVTVGVDPVSGIAGLIWPGDRVDLVLTQTSEAPDQPIDRKVFSETVLSDVRVIAVDQQMVQGGQASGQNGAAVAPTNRTVTLEASSYDAERVTTAARLGKLSLVVRSAASDDLDASTATKASSVLPPLTQLPAALPGSKLAISPAMATQPTASDASAAKPAGTTPPIAWGGDVSPALREHTKKGSSMNVHTGTKDEAVKF